MSEAAPRYPKEFWLVILGGVLILLGAAGVLVGEVAVAPADAWQSLLHRLGIGDATPIDPVLWSIRVPRVLAALLVGASLGTAGVFLQGVYRNQMADPYLLGVASAAGLGAALAISLTPSGTHALVIIGVAAIAGASFAVFTRRIARSVVDPARFVLVGVMLGIAIFAWTVILVFVWDSPRLPTFTYFVFGSLGGITWEAFWSALAFCVVGVGLAALYLRELDLFSVGHGAAGHLGVDVERVAALVLIGTGLAVGASVGLAGVIGFVGLLAPFAARSWVGPSHGILALASAMTGAIFVLMADIVARWLAGPVEVPIGIVTAALGGPLLVWMVLRRSRVGT